LSCESSKNERERHLERLESNYFNKWRDIGNIKKFWFI
jgi:hypothetical protein